MLGHLVESTPRRARLRFGTFVSVVAHALIISAAVAAARPVPRPRNVVSLIPLHAPPTSAPEKCTQCGSTSRSNKRRGELEFVAPDASRTEPTIDVPDIGGAGTTDIQIGREEWQTGTLAGPRADTGSALSSEFVDRQVVPLPTNPSPEYPAPLRAARIEGAVSARFVVDTTGRVIMESVVIDATAHRLFTDAVIEALRRARFRPAELRDTKVRQLVVQPFLFVLRD